jgi:hypothetical protein
MNAVHVSITMRPMVKEYLTKQAKKRQLSLSRYIESMLYKEDDEDYKYTMEELEEGLNKAIKDDEDGKLLTFNTPEESLSYILEHED